MSESRSVVSDSLQPHGHPWNSPGQNNAVDSLSLLQDLPNPGIEHRSPTLQADSLPAELPGKPKKTGVGRLSLLQLIFPTQESNQGPLHCRQILYQLKYQGSPRFSIVCHLFSHVRLCDPMDCSPPGSSIHGILQATVLEWDAIAFSNAGIVSH